MFNLHSMRGVEKYPSKLHIDELREAEVMKYWSLPPGSSANQKQKLEDCISGTNYIGAVKRDGSGYKYLKNSEAILSLTSRTTSAKTGSAVNKIDNFPDIATSLDIVPTGTCFAGEICFTDRTKTSSEITKITGALPKKAIERQKTNPVVYYIFDILAWGGVVLDQVPAFKRYEIIKEISKFDWPANIEFIEPVTENLEEFIADALARGEEGAVLLHKNSPYYFKRTPAWQSIKVKISLAQGLDLVIMGFNPPNKDYTGDYPQSWMMWENVVNGELEYGNYYGTGHHRAVAQHYFEGMIGGFQLGVYQGNKLVEVCKVSNLTDVIREDATNNKDRFLGRVVEVNAMAVLHKTKGIRHPKFVRFRDDKNANECTWDSIYG